MYSWNNVIVSSTSSENIFCKNKTMKIFFVKMKPSFQFQSFDVI